MTWFRSEYVHIILISPGRTTFQRVNWTESGKPVSVTLPTRVPRGAYLVGTRSSPSSRGPQRFHVLSTLHPAPNPRRRFPNGDVQPSRILSGRIQQQGPGKLRSKHIHLQSSLHFPGPLMSNLESPCGHDSGQFSHRRRH